jgi:hypothetical protein
MVINMTKSDMKAAIVEVVTECQGCKAIELLCKLPTHARQGIQESSIDFPDLIEEMVAEGSLVEVEYILPNMKYRAKSFLLPPGTSVTQMKCIEES